MTTPKFDAVLSTITEGTTEVDEKATHDVRASRAVLDKLKTFHPKSSKETLELNGTEVELLLDRMKIKSKKPNWTLHTSRGLPKDYQRDSVDD